MSEKKTMEQKNEKVLILSLGTGSVLFREEQAKITCKEDHEKALLNRIQEGKFNYVETTYQLPSKEVMNKTAFVAEALIKSFHPQHVIIIGTVKSSWTGFYTRFTTETKNSEEFRKHVLEIDEIEYNNGESGIKLGENDLNQKEEQIQRLFSKHLDRKLFPNVHVLLIRYGINSGELQENYVRFCDFWQKRMERNTVYEVAFDITHSFRSIPLYNLSVMDYFRLIEGYHISIKKIFYGNLEAKYDNNMVSPIVDLGQLQEITELSRGISEFVNTGSSFTLQMKLQENSEDEEFITLSELLQDFDLALQLNTNNRIIQALHNLLQYVERENEGRSPYGDLNRMISETLRNRFIQNNDKVEEALNKGKFSDIGEMLEFQFVLIDWYISIKRYNMAIITAVEVYRSIQTIKHLGGVNKELSITNIGNIDNREGAVRMFRRFARKIQRKGNGLSGDERRLMDFYNKGEILNGIRIGVAHNQNMGDLITADKLKNRVIEFAKRLSWFRSVMLDDPSSISEQYMRFISNEQIKTHK